MARKFHNLAGWLADLQAAQRGDEGEALVHRLRSALEDLLELEEPDDSPDDESEADDGLEDGRQLRLPETDAGHAQNDAELRLAGPSTVRTPAGGVALGVPSSALDGRVPGADPVARADGLKPAPGQRLYRGCK